MLLLYNSVDWSEFGSWEQVRTLSDKLTEELGMPCKVLPYNLVPYELPDRVKVRKIAGKAKMRKAKLPQRKRQARSLTCGRCLEPWCRSQARRDLYL